MAKKKEGKIIKQKKEIIKRERIHLPYWLKGGIILLVIVLADFLILYLLSINNNLILQNKFFVILIAPFLLLSYIFSFFRQFCTGKEIMILGAGQTCSIQEAFLYAVISVIIIFMFYFIFGSLIGWVYGKTKKIKN